MDEPTSSPETPQHEPDSTAAVKSSVTLPTSVLALGFIAIALVGVLIATAIRSRPADPAAAAKDDPLMKETKARLQMLQSSVDQERAKLGMSPLYGNTAESAEVVAARITEDTSTLVAMAKGVKDLIADKDAEIDRVSQDLTRSLTTQKDLRDRLAAAQEQLNKALIEGSEASTLRSQLDAANKRIIALGDELRRMSEGSGEVTALAAERDQLLARIAELESQLSQASLFASTEAELIKEAVALFRALRELENKPDSEINTAYSQFAVKLGAMVMERPIQFPTGVSEVSPEEIARIEGFIGEAPPEALIFVVGYASVTGNVDANRILSSDRATAVARVIDQAKRSGQRVQAAYIGQTSRFSSRIPERNQICEVWQIVPKAQ
jgi:outer membrane protein OmpA-like peptidoglycan-associated protein